MGKLIYGFNVSLDGYIADAQGNIDWGDPSEDLHQYWNDFERETALSFYGRRLYELMSAYWPTADQAPDATPVVVDFARIWRDMVAPTAVGGGTPFFPTLPSWISLRLLENRTFPGGTVLLRYEAKHD